MATDCSTWWRQRRRGSPSFPLRAGSLSSSTPRRIRSNASARSCWAGADCWWSIAGCRCASTSGPRGKGSAGRTGRFTRSTLRRTRAVYRCTTWMATGASIFSAAITGCRARSDLSCRGRSMRSTRGRSSRGRAAARLARIGGTLLWAESRLSPARAGLFHRPEDPRLIWEHSLLELTPRPLAHPRGVASWREAFFVVGEDNGEASRLMTFTPRGEARVVARGAAVQQVLAMAEGFVATGPRQVAFFRKTAR